MKNQKKIIFIAENAFIFSILFTTLYGATDEVHQYFVPNRTCDIFDVIANGSGAVTAVVIIYLYNKYFKKGNIAKYDTTF